MILRFGKSKVVTGLVGLAGGILFSLLSFGFFFIVHNFTDAGSIEIAKNFFCLNLILSFVYSVGCWTYMFSEKPVKQEKYFTIESAHNMAAIACTITFLFIIVLMVCG